MHRGSGCDPLGDRVGEGEELLRAVPVDRPADDLAGGDIAGPDPEPRIVGCPEGPDPVRPEAALLQDAVQTIPGFPAHTVRCQACGGGGDIAGAIGGRLLPRRARGVPEKPVDTQGEEAVPPAPDRRLRHARPPNGPGRPARRASGGSAGCARSASESTIACRIDFLPMCLSPSCHAPRDGGGRRMP